MQVIAVDDEEIALKNLELRLQECQEISQIMTFLKPADALAWLEKNLINVAFLDINMRRMNGLDLARAVKEKQPACAIIFVTGYSEYAVDAFKLKANGYLLKPVEVEDLRRELEHILDTNPPHRLAKKEIEIRCFGNFEAFANHQPIKFERNKTKELLAYLVDLKGSAATTGELCAVLWEDKEDTPALRTQLRILLSDLLRSLKKVDGENIINKRRNYFAIATEQVDCDYYNLLKQDVDAINAYRGQYMTQYSWAEMTLSNLEYKNK